MMRSLLIGLTTAAIATGGAMLSASAYQGSRGGGEGHYGGGMSRGMGHYGGYGRGSMGRGGGAYRPGRVYGAYRPGRHGEGRYRPGRHGGRFFGADVLSRRHDGHHWCRIHPEKCGHWETSRWSRWGRYPRYSAGYGGGGSCWRWRETEFGPRREWVCPRGGSSRGSYGYYRYGGTYSKWVPGRHGWGHGHHDHGGRPGRRY